MGYNLYDKDNNIVNSKDLQNKGAWCKDGARREEIFIQKFGAKLNLAINPEKAYNKYAIDLINTQTQRMADLKTQNTPFFFAKDMDMDPTYAVTFNVKDCERYEENYPEIDIIYWIDWIALKYQLGNTTIFASPLTGIWKIPFTELKKLTLTAQIHKYKQRVNDTEGNAKGSYVLNILNHGFERIDL